MKKKRSKDEKLLEKYRSRSCDLCGALPPSDPHHIKSVGAGGGDKDYNLLSLCRKHHVEIHAKGKSKMINDYAVLGNLLTAKGWDQDPFGRWRLPANLLTSED